MGCEFLGEGGTYIDGGSSSMRLAGGANWLHYKSAAGDKQIGLCWITNSVDGDKNGSTRAKEIGPASLSHLPPVKCRAMT